MTKRVVRTMSIRFTTEDQAVLAKLEKLTGLRPTQIIRASLRSVLRKLEAEMQRPLSS